MIGHFPSVQFDQLGHFPFNSITKAITRYFTPLSPVLNNYYELAKPRTFTGDFEVEIAFTTNNTTEFQRLASTNDPSVNGLQLMINGAANTFYVEIKNGVTTKYPTSQAIINDGRIHKAKLRFKLSTDTYYVSVDGGVETSQILTGVNHDFTVLGVHGGKANGFFNGILANNSWIDKADPNPDNWITDTFTLDKKNPIDLYVYGSELSNGATSVPFGSQLQVASGLVVGTVYEVNMFGLSTSEDTRWNGAGWPTLSKGVNVLTAETATLELRDFSEAQTGLTISVREITNFNEVQAKKNTEYSLENGNHVELIIPNTFATATGYDSLVTQKENGFIANWQTNPQVRVSIDIPTEIGKTYTVDQLLIDSEASVFVYARNNAGGSGTSLNSANLSIGGHLTFEATTTLSSILWNSSGAVSYEIGGISVKELSGNALVVQRLPENPADKYIKVTEGWLGEDAVTSNGIQLWDGTEASFAAKGLGVPVNGYKHEITIEFSDVIVDGEVKVDTQTTDSPWFDSSLGSVTWVSEVGESSFAIQKRSQALNATVTVIVKRLIEAA